MFGNIFKKNKELKIYSPVAGRAYEISKVPDETFAQKMLGDGFAVSPSSSEIYSPIKGKIVSLFPTKHALGIETSNGVQVLVHMGINTVELKGIPFEIEVQVGDKVDERTLLAKVDLNYLKKQNVHDDIIVVFTDMDKIEKLTLNGYGKVVAGVPLGSCQIK